MTDPRYAIRFDRLTRRWIITFNAEPIGSEPSRADALRQIGAHASRQLAQAYGFNR